MAFRVLLSQITVKAVCVWQETRLEYDEKTGEVVARNPLEVVVRKPHGIMSRKSLGIVEKFDKIRPVGWITLTRFLFNRNIFPLTR